MARLILDDHPISQDACAAMHDKRTPSSQVRMQVHRLTFLLAAEATRGLPTNERMVETPLDSGRVRYHAGCHAIVPILRAGEGMVEPFQTLLLDAYERWNVNMSRDPRTLEPIFKGSSVPEHIHGIDTCFVLDPMLATGGSASATIKHLKERGAKRMVFVGVIGAPEGLARLEADHPDVPIILGTMGQRLNDRGYIMGLAMGDMGDRLFGTQPNH